MDATVEPRFCDGKLHFAVGIENTFVPQTRPGHRALDEYELTDHYRLWKEDLDLASATGAEAIRYGIPWYKIEPEPGRFVWAWLDRVIDRLTMLGLTPIVDLMHYGTPLWLENEFLNASYPQRVAAYAVAVAERYAGVVDTYTPLNEPTINAEWCGETGKWPPYLVGEDGWVKVATALAKGIVMTQDALRDVLGEKVTFVHVEGGLRYDVDLDASDTPAAHRAHRDLLIEDLVCGLVDSDHALAGYLRQHGLTDSGLAWHRDHTGPPDVMGVNFYPDLSTGVISADYHSGPPPRGHSGGSGLEEVLRRFAQRYGRPIFLTETSVKGGPDRQLAWLDESVRTIVELRRAGLEVNGYTWFPLFHLIDWEYRYATGPAVDHLEALGLFELAPDDVGVLHRRATPAVDRYRALAAEFGAKAAPTL